MNASGRPDTTTPVGELAEHLRSWTPRDDDQAALRDDYLEFIDQRGTSALTRESGRDHVTASCFVFTADLSRVLLCFHRKAQAWVQLGGHIDAGDASVAAAAFREAVEEGGLEVRPLTRLPLDVDRHALGSGFASCDLHWDIGYGAVAVDGEPVVSDESEHVAWWPVDALPTNTPPGFSRRIRRVHEAASAMR